MENNHDTTDTTKRAQSRRQWYDRNKAKAITQAKEYSQLHKERIAAQKKAWDARNREKKRAQMKAYYVRNKDRIKEYRERVKQENLTNLTPVVHPNRSHSSSSSSSSTSSALSNSDSEDFAVAAQSPPLSTCESPTAYLSVADLNVTVAAAVPAPATTAPINVFHSPMNIAALLNPET
ncbi:hypothetical protein DYB25_000953 [Aphanomyces astaci]|uniref:Uncharacterized protein n=1 Tax=Aphanomyces astaci TaxID=112090 RepID=A0A396ZQP5_APHAT|nr:hypothetical protein DYB36_007897 [Aphanomyces astaci]RHY13329.1 hypothetical protein DYB25_000953 [Aphanomyces astaci]RHY39743.1 hypothetical protein DYB38_007362 [Aphanomyces astaci]RHY56099.1 hypothetical protein DYB30_003031 [Aphanomyces astaci]RHY57246.1 hypothetical protein DYB34_001043 [Aphanomyces astaci]